MRLADLLEAVTLYVLYGITFVLLSILLGTSPSPLADAWLAMVDRTLFPVLDWPSAMLALTKMPAFMVPANFAYESIQWQPFLLICLLCLSNRTRACWTFMAAWSAALVVVMAIFSIMPALGAYPHFAITAADVPTVHDMVAWRQATILTKLRTGELSRINTDALEGIVSFPSFHAAGAVLLGWGFGFNRWTRIPFGLLNAGMFVSAAPIGGHYYIDLVAGVLVAILGIMFARRWGSPVAGYRNAWLPGVSAPGS